MPNRLAQESSPYLLQHKDNPVDWRPWGAEAIAAAKDEDKPIFLSIGYAACHWCHVMEHESFENPEIAALLNESFVCIKVDREERPDLDQIYMNAVQLLTGHGGWPMSVFLTPDLKPFYGGTYWPPHAARGMPGFDQVITAVANAWRDRRSLLLEQSTELTAHLQALEGAADNADATIAADLLQRAVAQLERKFDFTHGGFGTRPKFPHPMDLQVLLRAWRRWPHDALLKMVQLNLDKMARGGIYDHLAGGFARYSVDERWLVPHFEKMLYDNALLAGVYLDAYLATGEAHYAAIVREVCGYVLNDMTDDEGGFHSTEDADSEGEEGKFYVWTPAEIAAVLGEAKAERFCYVYDVTEEGNFEGHSILNLPKTIAQCAALRQWPLEELEAELAQSREKLLQVRNQRVRPGKDDKVLVSWNGLMIDSLARAGAVLDEPRFLTAAKTAATFLLQQLRGADGRLLHTWRHGQARLAAYLDDYACLANGLVSLYEATFEERWIDEAMRLADEMIARFEDQQAGGFFFTANDHEELLVRPKDLQDSSTPSGNSMAATVLARLGAICQRTDYLDIASRAAKAAIKLLEQAPTASGQMLIAVDFLVGPVFEIVVVAEQGAADWRQAAKELRSRYLPRTLIAMRAGEPDSRSSALDPLFAGKQTVGGQITAYICRDYECQAPVIGLEALRAALPALEAEHQSRRI